MCCLCMCTHIYIYIYIYIYTCYMFASFNGKPLNDSSPAATSQVAAKFPDVKVFAKSCKVTNRGFTKIFKKGGILYELAALADSFYRASNRYFAELDLLSKNLISGLQYIYIFKMFLLCLFINYIYD